MATFRDTDSSAKESFVYHAAGVAGRGGSSYIDSVILRDKDANTGWTSSGDGALEERRFYAQNWRADVVAITKSDGQPTEFIRYTSYGTAQAFAAADVNRDGTVNSTDASDWDNLYSESPSGAAIPVDFDFDGSSFNPDDLDAFTAAYTEASGWSNGGLGAGGGKLSRIGNRKGYAGYEYDSAIVSYHVRHRVYVPEIGRWTKRDPLGYVDGMSVYEYVNTRSIMLSDPSGLASSGYCFMCCGPPPCCGCGGGGNILVTMHCNYHDRASRAACAVCATRAMQYANSRSMPEDDPCFIAVTDAFMNACMNGTADPIEAANTELSSCRDMTANGCGARGGTSIPGTTIFSNCCDGHDGCYATCGANKDICDAVLMACMLAECARRYDNWIDRVPRESCGKMAQAIYLGVQRGGQGPFDRAQERACNLQRPRVRPWPPGSGGV